ncbi:MAG TPA: hypothetical protein VH637_24765 [Streptosporangiaceae bacterium]
MMPVYGGGAALAVTGRQAAGARVIAGVGHGLGKILILHAVWRFIRHVWLIPTFGPVIVIVVVVALVGLSVLRRTRWRRRRGW